MESPKTNISAQISTCQSRIWFSVLSDWTYDGVLQLVLLAAYGRLQQRDLSPGHWKAISCRLQSTGRYLRRTVAKAGRCPTSSSRTCRRHYSKRQFTSYPSQSTAHMAERRLCRSRSSHRQPAASRYVRWQVSCSRARLSRGNANTLQAIMRHSKLLSSRSSLRTSRIRWLRILRGLIRGGRKCRSSHHLMVSHVVRASYERTNSCGQSRQRGQGSRFLPKGRRVRLR
jgi:hypothetical protein